MGESTKKVKEAKNAAAVASSLPLNEQLVIFDKASTEEVIEKDELVESIQSVLQTFSEREQTIIQLYYFEELNLKEISGILDISESRISQIHKKLLRKVRESMESNYG